MKQRRRLFDPSKKIDEINVSPLIDIVFILLIFFIVTTVFVEETNRDYVRTARAKGASGVRVMTRHVLPNALIPILTRVVLAIPFLFVGSLLLESFFGIPGLGSITIDAINANDFATLRAMVYIGALLLILGQLMLDVAYTWADPRVRLS